MFKTTLLIRCYVNHIDGLVQERRNSIANVLELRLSWTNPSIWCWCWDVSKISMPNNICKPFVVIGLVVVTLWFLEESLLRLAMECNYLHLDWFFNFFLFNIALRIYKITEAFSFTRNSKTYCIYKYVTYKWRKAIDISYIHARFRWMALLSNIMVTAIHYVQLVTLIICIVNSVGEFD